MTCCFDLEKPPEARLATAEVPPDTTNLTRLGETPGRPFRPRVFHRHLGGIKKDTGRRKGDSRTFEDHGVFWYPDVAKSPRVLVSFKKYSTRLISENADLRILKTVNWVGFEVAHVGFPRCGEIRVFVEMRVLLESETSFVLEAAEVPKNFL